MKLEQPRSWSPTDPAKPKMLLGEQSKPEEGLRALGFDVAEFREGLGLEVLWFTI